MTSPRVALISFHACPLASPGEGKSGGMNVYVSQLSHSLNKLGIEVDIFTRNHHGCHTEGDNAVDGVRVIHLPGGYEDASMDALFGFLPEFLDGMRNFVLKNHINYEAVHSHYWLSGWIGRLFSQELHANHVITFHTLSLIKMQSRPGEFESLQRQNTERELIAGTRSIVAFSPHERDAMARLYGANLDHITLVPCGVDLGTFRPISREVSRGNLGLNGDKILLYVGRIESLKGLDLLVHTAAQIRNVDDIDGMKVVVVGGDDGKSHELDRIKKLTHELNVSNIFDFVGRVDQDELPMYYSAADVCVVPSFYESFGLAALESMACGTPVVASRVGGLSTVVKHGSTGYLQSWRCPEAFANSVEMIMSSQNLRDSMGIAARNQAETLGWDNVARQMINIYGV
ncbi:MAG: hypothetical protein CL886_01205 [Dehalococcoidia bacterium]|nr:hypothetical protein [Dehalococcoidia bacterium]